MADEKSYRTLEQFEARRWGLTIITAALIAGTSIIAGALTRSFWYGIILCVVLGLVFWLANIRYFPAPTKWMPMVGGVEVNHLKMWGIAWLPWMGFLSIGYKEMPGGFMHDDLEPVEMIPEDRVSVIVPIHIVYAVDNNNPMQVLLLGGVENAKKLLLENIGKLLRQWITHPEKGPQKLKSYELTMDRVRQMKNEAVNYILEELFRGQISSIASSVPVEALIGEFEERPLSPAEQKAIHDVNALPPAERDSMRAAVRQRMADIDDLRSGRKAHPVPFTGLDVRQIVIDNIEPDKAGAAAAARVAAENFEQERQMIKTKNIAERAEVLKKVAKDIDPLQAVLIMDGNIQQHNNVNKLETSAELNGTIQSLGATLIAAIFGRSGGGKEANSGNNDPGPKPTSGTAK